MRWEDERYVRVYTRDTTDWVALGWEAQSLLVLTMRKMDRAGILELGKSGVRGLAALVVMPLDLVERALPVLLADGCLTLNGSTLVMPNFIEAQEAAQSDKHRKAESRARARDKAASSGHTESRNVTGSHERSQGVTPGPTESQKVTPCCAVPSRAEEDAAATRASARSDSPKLGSGAAEAAPPPPAAEAAPEPGPSASPGTAEPAVALEGAPTSSPTPAAVGHSAEAATPSTPPRPARRAAPPVEDDAPPPRKLQVLDLTDLDELAAELRVRLQERMAPETWRPPVSAPERRISARAELERLVSGLGLASAEDLAWRAIQRRQRQGLKPPAVMAWFIPLFEEKFAGGNPMPVEVPGVDVNQVLAARDAEVEARWAPLMARLTPSQREELSAEKARLEKEIRSQGLWTSQENLLFHETEGWLFEKWSRKAASGEA